MTAILTGLSFLFIIIYIIIELVFYKRINNEKYSFKNHFPFELMIKNRKYFANSAFLFASIGCFVANFLINTVKNQNPNNLVIALASVFVGISIIFISFLPLSKLKEHFLFSLLVMAGTALISGMNLLSETRIYKIDSQLIYLVPIIINLLILLISLLVMLNPKLFNLNMSKDEEGKLFRPSILIPAISEWIMMFIFLFTQIHLLVF